MTSQPKFTNRLIHETSPYLKQHAHNPVDWYPWGEEALQRARELERPIFLSVGYSACHWCHVMEHESFEDERIGEILNDNFVSIKVDREERPDIDQIYMLAVQIMTRQGGWPMSVFMTHDQRPFFGGTYFPPRDHYGRPSFERVLLSVIQWWKEKRDAVVEQSDALSEQIRQITTNETQADTLSVELLRNAASQLRSVFDPTFGGFGSAPKFPHPMDLSLLLRIWKRFGDSSDLQMVTLSLDMMARGGMYDQLGGGFHRYSTDERWLVPHFEKMLYDNALLVQTYVEAYQATGNAFYKQIVDETLRYVQREMTSDDGAFYSTQDADSEGEEGKFFVWSRAEVENILGIEGADLFASVYDVTEDGNWEGKNILHRARSDEQDAKMHNMDVTTLRQRLDEMRAQFLAKRSERIWPGLDDKILTSWNGLMIAAFARAGQVFANDDYVAAATKAAESIWQSMRAKDGRLLRTRSPGTKAKLNGYLEDYAYLLEALVALYEASFDAEWMKHAHVLAEVMIDEFWDAENGGFFDTGKQHEKLITRTKDPHDNATPSGNSVAATALLRLATLTGNADWRNIAERTLERFSGVMSSMARAAGQMLIALDYYLGPVQEFVVAGPMDDAETKQVLQHIHAAFRPNKVVAGVDSSTEIGEAARWVPLLEGKTAEKTVMTYICENFTCRQPLAGLEELKNALDE